MTRINIGINPGDLIDQHLQAELRELPRVFTLVMNRIDTGKDFSDIPARFTMGTGHVKFFYDKLSYLHRRYIALLHEYKARHGKSWSYPKIGSDKISRFKRAGVWNTWIVEGYEPKLVADRIQTRISEMKTAPRYKGTTADRSCAREYLRKYLMEIK